MESRALSTGGLPQASKDVELFNRGQQCAANRDIRALNFYFEAAKRNTSNNHGTGAAIRELERYAGAALGCNDNSSLIRASCLLAECYANRYGIHLSDNVNHYYVRHRYYPYPTSQAAERLAVEYSQTVLTALYIRHLITKWHVDLNDRYTSATYITKKKILNQCDQYIRDYDWILSIAKSSKDDLIKNSVFRVLLNRYSPPAPYGGHKDAAFHLAVCYENGYGTARDFSKALPLYREAALAQNEQACYRLGEIYESGLNVPQDLVAAAKWYSAASAIAKLTALAERNSTNAAILNVLAKYYQKEDLGRSIRLYERSARLGNDVAMQKYTLAFQQSQISLDQFLSTLTQFLHSNRSRREISQATLEILNTAIRTAPPATSNKIKASLAIFFMEANIFVQAARFISGLDPLHLTPTQNLKIGTFLQQHCGDDFAIFQFVSTWTRLFSNGREQKQVVSTLADKYLTAAKVEGSSSAPALKLSQLPPGLFQRDANIRRSRCAEYAAKHSLRVSVSRG